MFEQTLSRDTKKALALLGQSKILDHAYLAGGTACALHLGHRISIDLDFFTPQEFDVAKILHDLQNLGKFEAEETPWGTILGKFENVRFSLFVYQYPALAPFHSYQQVQVADLKDITAMKIEAIGSRGIKRDFVDLYFICQGGISLQEALVLYEKKYEKLASQKLHLLKSLTYFVDADVGPMPQMLKKIQWEDVKKFFESQIKKLI